MMQIFMLFIVGYYAADVVVCKMKLRFKLLCAAKCNSVDSYA